MERNAAKKHVQTLGQTKKHVQTLEQTKKH
jgi:hypothetical protein